MNQWGFGHAASSQELRLLLKFFSETWVNGDGDGSPGCCGCFDTTD